MRFRAPLAFEADPGALRQAVLVVVSLARPTLGLMWFVPLGMVVTPGSGSPTPFETAATLIVASLTLALALRATLGSRDPARAARSTGMEPALS